MRDLASLAADLTGLVGWHPAAGVALPDTLLESRSGLYVQDLNELLHFDVLRHLVPESDTLPAWLERLQKDALLRLLPNLTSAQALTGKVLLPETPLVKGPGRLADGINKLGRFVGLEFRMVRKAGVRYTLPRLSLQLDSVLSQPLTLYLYSSASPEFVGKVVVPAGANKAGYPCEVELADTDLTFASDYGVTGWLGYYEDDLPLGVRAIHKEVGPCGCADDPFVEWSKHTVGPVRPFAAPAVDGLWHSEAITYAGGSYGLNPVLLAYCDVAGALQSETNQQQLAPLVQKALGIRLLEALVSSSNITQLTGRQDVQADAYALLTRFQAQFYGGRDSSTDATYPSMLKNLTLDLSGLDKDCLPQKPVRLSMGSLRR